MLSEKTVIIEWQFDPGTNDYTWEFGSITAAEFTVIQHTTQLTMNGKLWHLGAFVVQEWNKNGLVRVTIPLYSSI